MNRKPLRAALLLNAETAPAWVYEAIRRIAAEGHARWSLIILDSPARNERGVLQRLWQNRHIALASSYAWLDRLVSPADRDPLASCNLTALLADIPKLEIVQQSATDRFSAADITKIESEDLDVIVHFGAQRPQARILAAAKLGVWSFKHGGQADAGCPELAGLLEVVQDMDVNRSTLEMLSHDGRNLVLSDVCSAVDRLSASRNRSNLFWPAVSLLPRQFARLRGLGPEAFRANVEQENRTTVSVEPSAELKLTNRMLLPGLARLAGKRLRRKWTKQLYRDQWFMLSHFNAEAKQPCLAPNAFQEIIPPRDRFWADPQVVCRDGTPYVFFEEYVYQTGKAHISVMEFDDRGKWQSPRQVLERPYHLSYPFLFTWQGEQYMIPETSANRTLEVYRCDEFPDRWSLHKVLWQNVNAYDATLVEHAGHWWMFVTLAENDGGSSWDELFLFHADHPLSDHWMPHPCNPIVSDVRRARPAGPLFVENGKLYRPAQDCSRTYGYGIRLHRIEELSPTRYAETEVGRIEPLADRGWLATHTLSFAGGLTMIDAQRRRCKFSHTSSRPMKTTETPRLGEEIKINW